MIKVEEKKPLFLLSEDREMMKEFILGNQRIMQFLEEFKEEIQTIHLTD